MTTHGDHCHRPSPTIPVSQFNAIHKHRRMAFPMSGDKRLDEEGQEKRVRRHYANYRKGAA